MTDEENEQKLEEIQKEVDEEIENPTEEELPDEHPLRFIACMLAREPFATLAWFGLGIIFAILIMNSGIVRITPDLSMRVGDVGMILMAVYIGVSAYLYNVWRRRVKYVKENKSQSEQLSQSVA